MPSSLAICWPIVGPTISDYTKLAHLWANMSLRWANMSPTSLGQRYFLMSMLTQRRFAIWDLQSQDNIQKCFRKQIDTTIPTDCILKFQSLIKVIL